MQPGDDFQPVQLGNADVEYDEVGNFLAGDLEPVNAVIGFADDFESFLFHQDPDGESQYRVIVNDEDFVVHDKKNML